MHNYKEDYFESNTLILIYLYKHSSGFKWRIINSYKRGNTISLDICDDSYEVQPMTTTSSYCVEVEEKKKKKVEVKRITTELIIRDNMFADTKSVYKHFLFSRSSRYRSILLYCPQITSIVSTFIITTKYASQ